MQDTGFSDSECREKYRRELAFRICSLMRMSIPSRVIHDDYLIDPDGEVNLFVRHHLGIDPRHYGKNVREVVYSMELHELLSLMVRVCELVRVCDTNIDMCEED